MNRSTRGEAIPRQSSLRKARYAGALLVSVGLVVPLQAEETHYLSYTIGAPGNISEVALKGDTGTGAAQPGGTYAASFPIEVPPGPRGTAPHIAINYTGGGSGWVGKGWSLGFGSVSRDTRDGVPQDLTGVGTDDRFLLNGMRLVRQGSTNRYRTEIEGHQYITYDSVSGAWIVRDPDGTRSDYSVQVAAYDRSGNNIGIREWLLGSVSDTLGNTITFSYTPSYPSGGISYPQRVTWGSPGTKTVLFGLGARPDTRTSYAEGCRVFDDQRLMTIDVMFGPPSAQSLLRRYTLGYEPNGSPTTGASLLTSITESGLNGAGPTRTTQFTYTVDSVDLQDDPSFLKGLTTQTGESFLQTVFLRHSSGGPNEKHYHRRGEYKGNVMVADLDNDGIPEFIQGMGGDSGHHAGMASTVWTDGLSGKWKSTTTMNVPSVFRDLSDQFDCCKEPDIRDSYDFGARFIDLDRDGAQDLMVSSVDYGAPMGNHAWLNRAPLGAVWQPVSGLVLPTIPGTRVPLHISYYRQDAGVRIADVNGDGDPDFIHAYSPDASYWLYPSAHQLQFNDGSQCYDPSENPRPPSGQEVYLKNGTALQWIPANSSFVLPHDVYFVGPVPTDAYEWSCPDERDVGKNGQVTPRRYSDDRAVDADLGTEVIDVNGDGLPDLVKATSYWYGQGCYYDQNENPSQECTEFHSPGNGVYLNTGSGWEQTPSQPWTQSLQATKAYLHARDRLCTTNCLVKYSLADVNDDGLPDVLKNTNYDPVNGNSTYEYYRNTGNGWTGSSYSYAGSFDLSHGQVFEDFNGDGRPDLFSFWRSVDIDDILGQTTTVAQCSFRASPDVHPDLLKTIQNWMGGRVTLSYTNTSDWRYQHNGNLPQPRFVVSEVDTDADPGAVNNPNSTRLRAADPVDGATKLSKTTYKFHGRRLRRRVTGIPRIRVCSGVDR